MFDDPRRSESFTETRMVSQKNPEVRRNPMLKRMGIPGWIKEGPTAFLVDLYRTKLVYNLGELGSIFGLNHEISVVMQEWDLEMISYLPTHSFTLRTARIYPKDGGCIMQRGMNPAKKPTWILPCKI